MTNTVYDDITILLEVSKHSKRTVEVQSKTMIYPKFNHMGFSRVQKIKNKQSKNIVIMS